MPIDYPQPTAEERARIDALTEAHALAHYVVQTAETAAERAAARAQLQAVHAELTTATDNYHARAKADHAAAVLGASAADAALSSVASKLPQDVRDALPKSAE